MRKHPWLQLRNNTWYMRAIVPSDLVESMGRREIWKSLKTDSRKLADIKIQSLAARQAIEFDHLRSGLRREPTQSGRDHIELAVTQFAQTCEENRKKRLPSLVRASTSSLGLEYEKMETEGLLHYYATALRDNDFSVIAPTAQELVKREGLTVQEGSESWNYLCHLMLRVVVREQQIEQNEMTGVFSPTFDPVFDRAPGQAKPQGQFITLKKAIERYTSEKSQNWAPKTALYYRAGFSFLLRQFGDNKRLAEITRDELRAYRDLVKCSPSAPIGQFE